MWREKKRNQGSVKTTVEISVSSQPRWGCPAENTETSPDRRNVGATVGSPLPGRHRWFCLTQCHSGFQNITYFCNTSALQGNQKGAAEIDTGHAFRGVSLGQRGEGIPCHVRKEAAGTAGARVSFLSGCFFQQVLSCSLPARGGERFFPLPPSPCPAPRARGDEQQACAAATSGLPMPSSYLGPNLDPLRVRNFY